MWANKYEKLSKNTLNAYFHTYNRLKKKQDGENLTKVKCEHMNLKCFRHSSLLYFTCLALRFYFL